MENEMGDWPSCGTCNKPMEHHASGLRVDPGQGTTTAWRCPDGHEGYVEIELN